MLHQNVLPTGASFLRILKEISANSHLEGGKHVHACIRHSPFIHDVAVRSTLVSMYGRCGSFDDALKAFIDMSSSSLSSSPSPSHVITWNAMISVCGRHQQGSYAHHLFEQMLLECVIASNVTLISLIKAYTRQSMLSEGEQIHARIYGSSLEEDVMIRNNLLSMYTECDRAESGSKLFDNAPSDIYTNGDLILEEGKHIRSHAYGNTREANTTVKHSNLDMHTNKCSVNPKLDGLKLFDSDMSEERSVVLWTNLISSYVSRGCLYESLSIYKEMQEAGVHPNSYTFVTLLSGCSNNAATIPGKLLHFHVICCYHSLNTIIGNALIRMYSMCGCLEDACKVFEDLNNPDDVVSWTTIITAYTHHRIDNEAIQTFKKMQERGVFPDKITFLSVIDVILSPEESKRIHVGILSNGFEQDIAVGSALVSMYRKHSQVENAWHAFNRAQYCNLVSRNILIATFAEEKQPQKAFSLFYQILQEGFIPNNSTFVAILEACASNLYHIESSHMHVQIVSTSFGNDVTLQTSLIHMYGKSGNVERAWNVFSTSRIQDRPIWNAMIQVFSQYGKANEAIQLFDRMNHNRVAPDEITFMGMLLACNHSGLMDEGWRCLSLMVHRCAIEPDVEHFNCMVDLLGRAGCIDEGELLIKSMTCTPNVTTWTALLGACRMHRNLELAEIAAMHAYKLEPRESGTYVLLSDIHVEAE